MRIPLTNREKELIHKYWYLAADNIKSQLSNKRRKTVDIPHEEINDLMGFLALECNHCNNKQRGFELNELCDKLEAF